MIVVDSSVWIDFLRGTRTAEADTLTDLIGRTPLLVGDLMLCEILQGVPNESEAGRVEAALRRFEIVAIVSDAVAVLAAAHYRTLRARGITIRKTIDLLIGAFCLRHRHTLLHRDRDFDPMQSYLGLSVLAP